MPRHPPSEKPLTTTPSEAHRPAGRNDQTTPMQSDGPKPKLPHERDESADTAPEPDALIQQAHRDVVSGKVDTDKGPVLEELNRRLPPSPVPKGKRAPGHPPR
ncbi:MAG TPA: hypothetical protein VLA61_16525 [Ideonella sp.]|uniref:hypothetical protein n=1 Tax=Ideonella sp. TaxID=1929293 RepID=UPI002C103C84|nr:hypothetical protein [Ideonella sp.]HSI49879.1 hypothetical protein [Ideonella sp.]